MCGWLILGACNPSLTGQYSHLEQSGCEMLIGGRGVVGRLRGLAAAKEANGLFMAGGLQPSALQLLLLSGWTILC